MLFRKNLRFGANAALLAGLALASGCTGETESAGDPNTFPAAALTTMDSDAGDLFIEVRTAPQQPPGRGVSNVDLHIVATVGKVPLDALVVSATPWMPDMGHGASVEPTVSNKYIGHYLVSDVEMFMPGRWELRISTTGVAEDSAKVTFQIP